MSRSGSPGLRGIGIEVLATLGGLLGLERFTISLSVLAFLLVVTACSQATLVHVCFKSSRMCSNSPGHCSLGTLDHLLQFRGSNDEDTLLSISRTAGFDDGHA